VLFTNWGRIGDYRGGQFQNTPFGTAEQAIEEFEKIFKVRSMLSALFAWVVLYLCCL
jgi:predicted DNA-binding WGR domain protein